jgi:hypothetical protein
MLLLMRFQIKDRVKLDHVILSNYMLTRLVDRILSAPTSVEASVNNLSQRHHFFKLNFIAITLFCFFDKL